MSEMDTKEVLNNQIDRMMKLEYAITWSCQQIQNHSDNLKQPRV